MMMVTFNIVRIVVHNTLYKCLHVALIISVNFIIYPKGNSLVVVIIVTALPEHMPSDQPQCCVSVIILDDDGNLNITVI